MNNKQKHIPIYKQLIGLIATGFNLLNKESQQEVRQFIADNQLTDGGFSDRGGISDMYYSLFGFWLSKALNMEETLDRFNRFIQTKKLDESGNTLDHFAFLMIKSELDNPKRSPRFKWNLIQSSHLSINFSYRIFLFLLRIDARHRPTTLFYLPVSLWLKFYKPSPDSSCSMIAALTVVRVNAGLNCHQQQKDLLAYFEEKKGFKAFDHVKTGDMLSTAVALFALWKTGFDMRLVAPTCLEFVQQNYDQGAFRSGDGDETHDLEYTFYGLLALGILAQNN